MIIEIETAKSYLLERVGELKNQLPNGDPFVFLGAFVVLRTLGALFNVADFHVLEAFADYERDEASVISNGARLMMERFTLTPPQVVEEFRSLVGSTDLIDCSFVNPVTRVATINKLNLSHKDRQHRVRKSGKLTISANAFLEDVEGAITKIFDSVKGDKMKEAHLFLNINSQPLIGYGD